MRATVDQPTTKPFTIYAILAFSLIRISPVFAQGEDVEVTEQTTNGRVFGREHNLTERDPNLSLALGADRCLLPSMHSEKIPRPSENKS